MSDHKALLREIDEWLEDHAMWALAHVPRPGIKRLLRDCREALSAQPAEPVAWMYTRRDGKQRVVYLGQWGPGGSDDDWKETPLYAAPPAAEPKQQTDDSLPASVGGAAAPRE